MAGDGWVVAYPPLPDRFFCRLLRDGFPQAARHSCRLAWRARALAFSQCVCVSLSCALSRLSRRRGEISPFWGSPCPVWASVCPCMMRLLSRGVGGTVFFPYARRPE